MKFESRNPFSDEHIFTYEFDTREEVISKIIEAKNAYKVWSNLTIEERATYIYKFAIFHFLAQPSAWGRGFSQRCLLLQVVVWH